MAEGQLSHRVAVEQPPLCPSSLGSECLASQVFCRRGEGWWWWWRGTEQVMQGAGAACVGVTRRGDSRENILQGVKGRKCASSGESVSQKRNSHSSLGRPPTRPPQHLVRSLLCLCVFENEISGSKRQQAAAFCGNVTTMS